MALFPVVLILEQGSSTVKHRVIGLYGRPFIAPCFQGSLCRSQIVCRGFQFLDGDRLSACEFPNPFLSKAIFELRIHSLFSHRINPLDNSSWNTGSVFLSSVNCTGAFTASCSFLKLAAPRLTPSGSAVMTSRSISLRDVSSPRGHDLFHARTGHPHRGQCCSMLPKSQ